MEGGAQQVVLVRHGETEWSRSGQHTGRTDIPLTEEGRCQAMLLAPALHQWRFATVLTSPMSRAQETCRLAGFSARAKVRENLGEWDYGDAEGRTTIDIRRERPGWSLWRDGTRGGETVDQVGQRADRIIAEVRAAGGDVALFAHGHILRILAARWIGLLPDGGRTLALGTATLSVLGYEREQPVILRWNLDARLLEPAGR